MVVVSPFRLPGVSPALGRPRSPLFVSAAPLSRTRVASAACPTTQLTCPRRRPATASLPADHPRPVLTPSDSPTEGSLSSPVVHQYFSDDGPHYVMWYTVRPQADGAIRAPPGTLSGQISLALSDDGLVWRRVQGPFRDGSILAPNDEEWWAFDTAHLSAGSVLLASPARVRADAGVYLLYYSAGGSDALQLEDRRVAAGLTRIGVAISKDGEHFSRIEGEHHSAAVLDVSSEPAAFDSAFVAAPSVIDNDTAPSSARYQMFYHGASTTNLQFAIGRAVSDDAFKFQRDPSGSPVLTHADAPRDVAWASGGVCRPSVVKRADELVMFVEVIDDEGVHRIAMSRSLDGRRWDQLQLVLDVGQPDDFDAAGVSHPCVVPIDGGAILLYYVGKRSDHSIAQGRGTSIGVAQSLGSDWTVLSRRSGGAVLSQ